MKHIIALILAFITIFLFCSCTKDYVPSEQPVSYAEDIYVTITKIDKKQWFAGTTQREVEITVYSEEYSISGKDTIRYTGMFGNMKLWEAEKGDTIKARMIVFYLKSTGQVTNRYIDKIYS